MTDTTARPASSHSLLADAQGIVFGTTMAAVGIVILTTLGLVTGQTAGLAVVISYATGWEFGPIFFVLNIPFYWLGYRRIGLAFTLKTFAAVALLTVLSGWLPDVFVIEAIWTPVGAVIFGMITGAGLLALFRHGSSLGGVGILALYLQDKTGFRAGWTQLTFDAFVIPFDKLIWSALGALVINLVIAINHRRDWYVAT